MTSPFRRKVRTGENMRGEENYFNSSQYLLPPMQRTHFARSISRPMLVSDVKQDKKKVMQPETLSCYHKLLHLYFMDKVFTIMRHIYVCQTKGN